MRFFVRYFMVSVIFLTDHYSCPPPGWGDLPSSHAKSESSWGEPAPSPVSVDNGTAAWGKPSGSCGGWGDSNPDSYGRGNPTMTSASCKPGKQLNLMHYYEVFFTVFIPF